MRVSRVEMKRRGIMKRRSKVSKNIFFSFTQKQKRIKKRTGLKILNCLKKMNQF